MRELDELERRALERIDGHLAVVQASVGPLARFAALGAYLQTPSEEAETAYAAASSAERAEMLRRMIEEMKRAQGLDATGGSGSDQQPEPAPAGTRRIGGVGSGAGIDFDPFRIDRENTDDADGWYRIESDAEKRWKAASRDEEKRRRQREAEQRRAVEQQQQQRRRRERERTHAEADARLTDDARQSAFLSKPPGTAFRLGAPSSKPDGTHDDDDDDEALLAWSRLNLREFFASGRAERLAGRAALAAVAAYVAVNMVLANDIVQRATTLAPWVRPLLDNPLFGVRHVLPF